MWQGRRSFPASVGLKAVWTAQKLELRKDNLNRGVNAVSVNNLPFSTYLADYIGNVRKRPIVSIDYQQYRANYYSFDPCNIR